LAFSIEHYKMIPQMIFKSSEVFVFPLADILARNLS